LAFRVANARSDSEGPVRCAFLCQAGADEADQQV
jgi:hypothetical protein